MDAAYRLTDQELEQLRALGRDDLLEAYLDGLTPLELFQPRPDDPSDYEEQTAFLNYQGKVAVCLGGTGSGKTVAAAVKTARYVLNTPPPRPLTPFWVIGDTFETVCGICWDEKLSKLIPEDEILDRQWYNRSLNYPYAVVLRDPVRRNEPGWVLQFKSYSQGRRHMQGRSIGGAWFNEECPFQIVQEVLGRTRDYDSPVWADFTPIEIVSQEWPDLYDEPPAGWRFFHLNVERNTALAPGWAERFLEMFPPEERETRRVGVFATFHGQVFKEFMRKLHVIDAFPDGKQEPPYEWQRIRGIDWGYSNPLACVWVAVDRDGRYYVYDEHYEAQKPNSYHVARIQEREWTNPNCGLTYCDTADPQQMVEFTRLGVQCHGANKGIGKYPVNSRISLLRSLMMMQGDAKPRIFIHSRCKNLIREIRAYHWSLPIGADARTKNAPNQPVDFDNHALDAMGYAIYTHAIGTGSVPAAVRRPWVAREGVRVDFGRRAR